MALSAILGDRQEMPEGLRERRKEEIRQDLSKAAIRLFLEQGFEATTIDEIVAPLGVSRRTFFRHFPTKEDLVFVWYEDLTEGLVAECAARPASETAYQAVCAALRSLLRLYDSDPLWSKQMMRLAGETPGLIGKSHEKRVMWEKALAAVVVDRLQEGPMRDHYARIIAGTAVNTFAMAAEVWFAEGANGNLRATVDALLACAGAADAAV
jgi:AcrR family transcriptional regulator